MLDANSLIKSVEDIIKNTEISNHQYTFFEHPHSPIIVIYTDDDSAKVHDVLINSLRTAWSTYDKKIVFAKFTNDNKYEYLEGLTGIKNEFASLFTRDYSLTDFEYNYCTVFCVTSSHGVNTSQTIFERIEKTDTLFEEILAGRQAIKYLVTLLDIKNKVSSEFRRECEQSEIECINDKKVFFIENRSYDGADLTDEISEKKLFKNLSYIIRMSQLPGVRVSNSLHLIGSQEVLKPYYEMAAGTIAGVVEKISAYVSARISAIQQESVSREHIAADLGFDGDTFEYIIQKKSKIQKYLPSNELLFSMPLAEPKEPNIESTAAFFNQQTMGCFFAYVDSIDIGNSGILSIEDFVLYLENKLTCFDIIKDFGKQDRIFEIIEYINDKIIYKSFEYLHPVKYVEQYLMERCKNEVLTSILEQSTKIALNDAKEYVNSINNFCKLIFSHGREDIYDYYKKKTFNKILDSDINSIGKISDFEKWILAFVTKIINDDNLYSLSLEDELADRIGRDFASISGTVVDELQSEDQYFTSRINYMSDVDVAGKIIFIDKESNLWQKIKDKLGAVTIFDMPENSELNIMKVYTYKVNQ